MKNDTDWSGITLTCAGSGNVQVLLNGTVVATVGIAGEPGKRQTVSAGITAPAGSKALTGTAELKLRVTESDGLEIMEIVLI